MANVRVINCFPHGSDPILRSIFPVNSLLTDTIGELRKNIWDALHDQTFGALDLILYTLKTPIRTDSKQAFQRGIAGVDPDMPEGLAALDELDNPTVRLTDTCLSRPAERHLHVIVVLPTAKRKRRDSDPGPLLERWKVKRWKNELPSVAELVDFADEELPENLKIPISASRFHGLVSLIDRQNICTIDNVKVLFREGSSETPLHQIFHTVTVQPPINARTENSYHSFWDGLVREILELVIPNGSSTRNSKQNTATGQKPPGSSDDPKKGLATKLKWAYGAAPYVLGYYAKGPDLTLVAIERPVLQGDPVVTDIVNVDLRLRKNRIRQVRYLINLARLFQPLIDIIRASTGGGGEFTLIERPNGYIEIAGGTVVKTFTGPDSIERVEHLRRIYPILREKGVPNVDSLILYHDTTVHLSPQGIEKLPSSEQELVSALVCVLEALLILHKVPIYHRDIQWSNIMRDLDNKLKWFIIDWDDASGPPTEALPHFNPENHCPGVFIDGHGAEVDIWSVGNLIAQCPAMDISPELKSLGIWMQGPTPPSAAEALEKFSFFSR